MRVARVDRTHGVGWRLVDFSAPGGLRMAELFDEVFAINWSANRACARARCKYGCHGNPAMVLWRVPKEMVVPRTRAVEWMTRENWFHPGG
ncbi:hypothetical protein MFIFM68171_02670 [Madurella fahalii]|uniref:Uncharacterized protein n=1 Tax=Madurella fahalii TaxID=1157608 RepID=A0ABQ0G3Y7_9PEZI